MKRSILDTGAFAENPPCVRPPGDTSMGRFKTGVQDKDRMQPAREWHLRMHAQLTGERKCRP